MSGRILVRATWLKAMQATQTMRIIAAMGGQSRLRRRPQKLGRFTSPVRSNSRRMELVTKYPVSTRNMTTPMWPLGSQFTSRWYATTDAIAKARRPSIDFTRAFAMSVPFPVPHQAGFPARLKLFSARDYRPKRLLPQRLAAQTCCVPYLFKRCWACNAHQPGFIR